MERPIFDYSKLRGRIKEVCGTQKSFAKSIGLSPTACSLKINNKSCFDQGEIQRSVDVLNIEPLAISAYFFTPKV